MPAREKWIQSLRSRFLFLANSTDFFFFPVPKYWNYPIPHVCSILDFTSLPHHEPKLSQHWTVWKEEISMGWSRVGWRWGIAGSLNIRSGRLCEKPCPSKYKASAWLRRPSSQKRRLLDAENQGSASARGSVFLYLQWMAVETLSKPFLHSMNTVGIPSLRW